MWWVKDDGNHVVTIEPCSVRVKLNGKVRLAPIQQLRPLRGKEAQDHPDHDE